MNNIKIKIKILVTAVLCLSYGLIVGVTPKTSATCGQCVQLTSGGNPVGWGCVNTDLTFQCLATQDSCDSTKKCS